MHLHGADDAFFKGGLAVAEVVGPLADEAVVEAERTRLIESGGEIAAPDPQRARVVGAEDASPTCVKNLPSVVIM